MAPFLYLAFDRKKSDSNNSKGIPKREMPSLLP